MDCEFYKFEERWGDIYKVITKLLRILEGLPEPLFTTEEYMTSYTNVYNICTLSPSAANNLERLYEIYCEIYEEYIASTVLFALREKHGEFLLRELIKKWENHRVMVRWLSHFFVYINSAYAKWKNLPTLHEVGIICFRDMVYTELNAKVVDVMIALLEKDRNGEQVDKALLKNAVDLFAATDMGKQLKCYQRDFEAAMLEDVAKYYSRQASIWILEDSSPEYMVKL